MGPSDSRGMHALARASECQISAGEACGLISCDRGDKASCCYFAFSKCGELPPEQQRGQPRGRARQHQAVGAAVRIEARRGGKRSHAVRQEVTVFPDTSLNRKKNVAQQVCS